MKKIIERRNKIRTRPEYVEFEVENQIAFIAQRGSDCCWFVFQVGRGNSDLKASTIECFQHDEKKLAVALAKSLATKAARIK